MSTVDDVNDEEGSVPRTLELEILLALVVIDVVAAAAVLGLGVVISVSEFIASDMLFAIDCSVEVAFTPDRTCRRISRGK